MDSMADIMEARSPRDHQSIGRKVKNYDDAKWDSVCQNIVAYANYLKFTQNPELLIILLGYEGFTFVEASPYDCKWGVGLAEDNTDIYVRHKWRGTNWLGIALNEVMAKILDDQKYWNEKKR